MVELGFHPGECVSTVQSELSKILTQSEKFDLFVAPPKRTLSPDSTLWDNGLCPRGACYLSLGGATVLPEIWEKAEVIEVHNFFILIDFQIVFRLFALEISRNLGYIVLTS